MSLAPQDLIDVGRACAEALQPAANADWTVKAGDLDWDCRQTLDHMINAQAYYATNLAMRSTARVRPIRNGDATASPAELVATIEPAVTVLARVAQEAPPEARGFHPAGMADTEGFLGMACNELLVHTHDVAKGLGLGFQPPADVCRRVVARIFPWVDIPADAWAGLLWSAGRVALPDRPRLEADWWVQCAPLAEWDGQPRKRSLPPLWR